MAWNNFLCILTLFMLVFIKNSFQTQCELYKKDFKSLGRHVWRCQVRSHNRETSVDSINTTSVGQSIVTSNSKATSISLFNNDYDPYESEGKNHGYRFYCGRGFTKLRGLNTHLTGGPAMSLIFLT